MDKFVIKRSGEYQAFNFYKIKDAIQKGLMEAGLYEDKRTQVGEALKHYSEQHPKKGTFDPEKFKAARAKRGVDEPGRG